MLALRKIILNNSYIVSNFYYEDVKNHVNKKYSKDLMILHIKDDICAFYGLMRYKDHLLGVLGIYDFQKNEIKSFTEINLIIKNIFTTIPSYDITNIEKIISFWTSDNTATKYFDFRIVFDKITENVVVTNNDNNYSISLDTKFESSISARIAYNGVKNFAMIDVKYNNMYVLFKDDIFL